MKVLVTTPNGKVGSELVKLLQKGNIPFHQRSGRAALWAISANLLAGSERSR